MSTEISTNDSNLPTHLQNLDKKETGLEEMGNYIVPPRLKIRQDKTDDERLENIPAGSVVLIPQMLEVANKDKPFRFTVLFTWDEFCIHSPYKAKDAPFILERTVDPTHEIAEKCRNRDEEPFPGMIGEMQKYVTHLNFLIAIHDVEEVAGIEVLMSFFVGEFKTGQGLLNLLRMRTNAGIPMYGHVLEASISTHRSVAGEKWLGFDITNPTADYIDEGGSQYVTDEKLYHQFENAYELAKANKEKILTTYDDEGPAGEPVEPVTSDTL